MFLGEYIKQYRSEHNMTMQEFADKASMTKGYVSMLADNKTDWAIIRRIVGHSGKGVTETVYTHYDMSVLLDAVNDICK